MYAAMFRVFRPWLLVLLVVLVVISVGERWWLREVEVVLVE